MEQLWAPWRMTYLECKNKNPGECCVFCIRDRVDEDARRLVLYRGRHAFVIMNKYPYNNGHLLLAPYRHVPDIIDLSDEEMGEMHQMLKMARNVLQEALNPQGFNIGINLGRIAGAGLADHLHMHIVPRWSGDTNFMPVFTEVRVLPQHLDATYAMLEPLFQRPSP